MSEELLIILAKAPVAGEVNTRLIPDIGVDAATDLQREFIMHRMEQFARTPVRDIHLYCSPDENHECFVLCDRSFDVRLKRQSGSDLGKRMLQAFGDSLRSYSKVVLLGTDAPIVDESDVKDAFAQLDAVDVVLKPAEDGGYVLIGMRRLIEAAFIDVPWGSDEAMSTTRKHLQGAGVVWSELSVSWDIDTVVDLERFRQLRSD